MMLLGLDTATPHVTVAVHDGSRVVSSYTSTEGMRHGENLAPAIERVLAEAGIGPASLTEVAVGVGPGPFTGLRVGLVTARTLGLALDVPVTGVCTLDVLAAEADLDDFWVATDARRKEVYLARYVAGRRVEGPLVRRPLDAATEEPVVGSGALLYPEAFPRAVGPTQPSAAILCEIVVARRAELSGADPSGPDPSGADPSGPELLAPQPLYLRRPHAADRSGLPA